MFSQIKNKFGKHSKRILSFLILLALFLAPFSVDVNQPSLIAPSEASASVLQSIFDFLLKGADNASLVHDGGDIISDATGAGDPTIATEGFSWDSWGVWLVSKIAEFIVRSLLLVLYIILWTMYSLLYSFVRIAEWVLEIIFDPAFIQSIGGFTQAQFVKKTAALVSNLCNIVYLFVLLYIAILSMLGRAETGRWLKKLIIAALLTNFSLVISGVIIDTSQILMYSFPVGEGNKFDIGTQIIDNIEKNILSSNPGKSGEAVAPTSEINTIAGDIHSGAYLPENSPFVSDQIDKISKDIEEKATPPEGVGGSFWTFQAVLFLFKMPLGECISKLLHLTELLLFCLAMVITLTTITTILTIRIVALWIILIVSPAAFLMYSFPPTEKYFSIWMDSLVKYAFTGPILIFFLFVAKRISEFMGGSDGGEMAIYLAKKGKEISDTPSLKDDFVVFVAKNFQIIFQFIVLTVTIWAGIIIANKFGIAGSASVDKLINRTRKWSKKGLVAVGGGVLASRMATWTGFGLANKLRGNKLSKLNASLGENQAKLANLDPNSLEYTNLSQEVDSQKTRKELLEEKMKRSAARKNRVMKAFALTSPTLLKKKFSSYLSSRNKDYYTDVETNLNDFTNYWLNRGKSVQLQTANAQRQSHELQNEINELTKQLATAKDDKETQSIRDKIEHYVKSLLKLSVKDEEQRKSLLPQLMQEIEDKAKNPSVIKDLLNNDKLKNSNKIDDEKKNIASIFSSIDNAISKGDAAEYKKQLSNLSQEINKVKLKDPSLASEGFILEAQRKIGEAFKAKFLPTDKKPSIRDRFADGIPAVAKENALSYLSGSKIKEETAKKIKEKMEEFKKDSMLNKDLLARKFAREELDPIEREAVLSFFSSSARDMSTLVRSINKEKGKPDGDIKNAMEFIEGKTSEFAAMRAFNNVQGDADKSKNLTLIGHTMFDKISGSYRSATEEERSQAINRTLNGMSDKSKLSKISPAVFQYDKNNNAFIDPLAVKAVMNSIDFKRIYNSEKLASEVVEDIASNTKKSLGENETSFSNFIENPNQRKAFEDFTKSYLK